MELNLNAAHTPVTVSTPFQHATNGQVAEFTTEVEVSYDENYLKVAFSCEDNLFTLQNTMTEHNAPLYNQEVFEVFIGAGHEDSKEYLEIEINPNSALWIGKISNPELGEGPQSIVQQFSPDTAGIIHSINMEENSWSGYLHIPWRFIGKDKEGNYRINFYRIRANVSHDNPNWECDAETCDFVCWQSTLSGKNPAFHRPKRFGYLKVNFVTV